MGPHLIRAAIRPTPKEFLHLKSEVNLIPPQDAHTCPRLAQASAAHPPLVIEQAGDALEHDGFGVNPDLLLLKLRDLRQVCLSDPSSC